jgi:hypothetical protein
MDSGLHWKTLTCKGWKKTLLSFQRPTISVRFAEIQCFEACGCISSKVEDKLLEVESFTTKKEKEWNTMKLLRQAGAKSYIEL